MVALVDCCFFVVVFADARTYARTAVRFFAQVLATSGIDNTIKLWVPNDVHRADLKVRGVEDHIAHNQELLSPFNRGECKACSHSFSLSSIFLYFSRSLYRPSIYRGVMKRRDRWVGG